LVYCQGAASAHIHFTPECSHIQKTGRVLSSVFAEIAAVRHTVWGQKKVSRSAIQLFKRTAVRYSSGSVGIVGDDAENTGAF
jgi:hypothetical protein